MIEILVVVLIILTAVVVVAFYPRHGPRSAAPPIEPPRPAGNRQPQQEPHRPAVELPQGESTRHIDLKVPDVGIPGTATERQISALGRAGFEIEQSQLSFEQASMMLSALSYAREVRRTLTGDEYIPVEKRLEILPEILDDAALRDYIVRWNAGRLARGTHHDPSRLRRNEHFDKVAHLLDESA